MKRRAQQFSVLGCALSLVLMSPTVFAQVSGGGSGSMSTSSGAGEASVSGSQSGQGGSVSAGASGSLSPTMPGGDASATKKLKDPTVANPRPGADVEDPSSIVDRGPLLHQDSSSLIRQQTDQRGKKAPSEELSQQDVLRQGEGDSEVTDAAQQGQESDNDEGIAERRSTPGLDDLQRDDDPATASGSKPRLGVEAEARADVNAEGDSAEAESDSDVESDITR